MRYDAGMLLLYRQSRRSLWSCMAEPVTLLSLSSPLLMSGIWARWRWRWRRPPIERLCWFVCPALHCCGGRGRLAVWVAECRLSEVRSMLCEGRRARGESQHGERKKSGGSRNKPEAEREAGEAGGGGREEGKSPPTDPPATECSSSVGLSVCRCIGPCHGQLGRISVWLKMGKPFG